MRKHILSSLLLIWSAQLFAGAATTIRLNTNNELVVTGQTTGSAFVINSAEPSGDGTAEASPAKVYVPMDGPLAGAADEAKYFIDKNAGTLFDVTSTSQKINFPLYVNALTVTNPFYIYVALKDNSNNYKIVTFSSSTYNGTTNLDVTFPVSVKEFCDQSGVDCSSFTSTSGTEKTFTAYFFLNDTVPTSLPVGTTITPSSAGYNNGIYFQLNMSNKVYTKNQVTLDITKTRPGDKRLILEYSGSAGITNPKAVRVISFGSTNPGSAIDDEPIVTALNAGGGLTSTEYPYSTSGQLTVTNLENGVETFLSVVMVNLYNIATVVSPAGSETPLEIQELLKKEGCFLLTAGFGEDHYVISYFRHFRDAVLAKSYLGKAFISFYYESAPKYALLIYKHETLRAMIRGMAYTLYFIFNNISLILLSSLFATLLFYLYKKREKIKI